MSTDFDHLGPAAELVVGLLTGFLAGLATAAWIVYYVLLAD